MKTCTLFGKECFRFCFY